MTDAIFPVLLEGALHALAAAMAVWIALRLLRVRNVRAQKAAWTLMLAGALAMPLLMRLPWLPASDAIQSPRDLVPAFSTGYFLLRAAVLPVNRLAAADAASPADLAPIPPPFAWSAHPNAAGRLAAGQPEFANGASIDIRDSIRGSHPATHVQSQPAPLPYGSVPPRNATAARPATRSLHIFDLASLLYLAIAAALLLRLIVGVFSALRLWMTAGPVLAPIAADLAPAGAVRCSPRLSSPANVGSGIVLPADYREWSDEKLRVVLAHEREHVRQGDFYLQLLAGFYAALVWFSPLGWWLKRKLSELGEAMSDRAGLQEAASLSSYVQVLLEFAALPRPIRAGVAMARAGRLASRIERLLNDSTFRQAFTAGGRRAVLALVIVPLALLASAALVRVQAASQSVAPPPRDGQAQAPEASQKTDISNPPPHTIDNQEPPSPNPAAQPSPAPQVPAPAPQAQVPPPAPPVPPIRVQVPPIHVHVSPIPPIYVKMPPMPDVNLQASKAMLQAMLQMEQTRKDFYFFHNNQYYAFDGGEPWALIPAQGKPIMNTRALSAADRAEIDKARTTAHAPFFWFKRQGKSYVVEDPSVVAQVETLEKPIEDLRSRMRALGSQQRQLGEQLRQQMRAERRQPIPKPDLSKQMADLNAAFDSLKASQGDTVTQAQLMKLQEQVAQLQGQIARAESGFYKQNGQWGAQMGVFGKQMGKFGAEQGRLAGEMAQMSMDNRGKIEAIIKQSLSDGKAKPVQ